MQQCAALCSRLPVHQPGHASTAARPALHASVAYYGNNDTVLRLSQPRPTDRTSQRLAIGGGAKEETGAEDGGVTGLVVVEAAAAAAAVAAPLIHSAYMVTPRITAAELS